MKTGLFIKHKAKPGKRDEVRKVWEKHPRPRIGENVTHEAYFYCYDDNDPDTIVVFQLHVDRDSGQEFTKQPWHPDYERETTPLLAGPSEFRTATTLWVKSL